MTLLAALALAGCGPGPAATPTCTDPPSSQSPNPDASAPVTGHPPTPPASGVGIYGKVYEGCDIKPIVGACLSIGAAGEKCWAKTDANGNYTIDLKDIVDVSANSRFYIGFVKPEFIPDRSQTFDFKASTVIHIDHRMRRGPNPTSPSP
ncbi:MAG: hypothetical protein M3R54_04160 [Chloroflexota bacterium]|nr:hypothetical protein [Chloroflexota bacterium]